jgi:S-adenosylmethionine hydrolase
MIAIFTDFGVQGPYLGQMRAVLLAQAPALPVVDIFPDLPPFHVQAAAYLIPAYSQYLPDNSVCVCIVDPGVGTNRRALVVRADSRWYVGPDNGLFSILIGRAR